MSDAARAEIEAEVLAWTREGDWETDDARFEALALALFRFQASACAPYGALLERRGVRPERVERWNEIPAVPSDAFKDLAVCSFPVERATHCFRTSGTSATRRGTLHLDTLALYEASLRPSFRRGLLPDLAELAENGRVRIRALAPSAHEVPDSSLSHMLHIAIREWGDKQSGFDVSQGEIDDASLGRALSDPSKPALLCATAFALVHWLDRLAETGRTLRLHPASRVMETGGFKGRSRTVTREALYARVSQCTGLSPERIVNQYGMTELGSQFYDSVLRDRGPRRKLMPPWTRLRIIDPVSGRALSGNATGVIEIVDLANTGSVLALRTGDLGRRVDGAGAGPEGFEVLGRAAGAEARGCSVAADDTLRV